MIKFNIGDKVRCINVKSSNIIEGNIYTVSIIHKKYITLKEIPKSLFWPNRFKKINQQLFPDELFEL